MLNEIEQYAVESLIKFYSYDYSKLMEYLDDNVIWYGPREGQYIVGKTRLLKNLEKLNKNVKYSVQSITSQLPSYSPTNYTVMVQCRLYIYYPDGKVSKRTQHIVMIGQKCRDHNGKVFWKCPFIHVSDVREKDEKLPEAYTAEISKLHDSEKSEAKRLVLPTDNYSSVYIKEDSIKYIVGGKGVMCTVYTFDEKYNIHLLLKDIKQLLPDYYYRCHSSYIVNLFSVRAIGSSFITMDDGTQIPIPVKRYKAIKADIDAWMMNRS